MVARDRDTDGNGSLDERLWVQQDANFNVTALVDGAGAVVERYVYDSYGAATVYTPAWAGRPASTFGWQHLHQGGRLDADTGLYHFRNRDYSPTLGRWTSRDPAGFGPGDPNLYRLVEGDPVNRLDPSGLDAFDWFVRQLPDPVVDFLAGPTVVPQPSTVTSMIPVVGDLWEAMHYMTTDEGSSLGNGAMFALHVTLAAADIATLGAASLVKAPVKGAIKTAVKEVAEEAVEKVAKESCETVLEQGGRHADDLAQGRPPCFAAGTPVRTPEGSKPIEQFKAGEVVLSRCEKDPAAPVVEKVITEVFARVAPVLNLRVGGKVIRTTAEHPFWCEGRGWIPAGMLEPGQQLLAGDGGWVIIEGVADAREVVTVYNFEVADHHTYFVGDPMWWGFDLWTHNHTPEPEGQLPKKGKRWTRDTDNEKQLEGIEGQQEQLKKDRPSIEEGDWDGAKKRPKQSGIDSTKKSQDRADRERNDRFRGEGDE